MKKLAIIGASYLQNPLILKAKMMGIETHVFAWKSGDIGEISADYFYPISIVEKEKILQVCQEIQIDGICSIASDLAAITVNYVANEMGLIGNSLECTLYSTNKHYMRECFEKNGDPSPKSIIVQQANELNAEELEFPMIVKPVDRSGSRGITKVFSYEELKRAVEIAKEQGFEKKALVEEFAEGQEYSVECVSWNGEHHFLAMTKKYTTGEPHFIERGHLEPAFISEKMLTHVKEIVYHALDSLMIRNGASHTELKISDDGKVALIEIGGRMGGDCIGSSLVKLSTGIDFVGAVIQIALGEKPNLIPENSRSVAAIRFVLSQEDVEVYKQIQKEHPEYIVEQEISDSCEGAVVDSSTRFGYYILCAPIGQNLERYMPE